MWDTSNHNVHEVNERQELIDGLRKLAAYIEKHDDLPTPNVYNVHAPFSVETSHWDATSQVYDPETGKPKLRDIYSYEDSMHADHWTPATSTAPSIPQVYRKGQYVPRPEFVKKQPLLNPNGTVVGFTDEMDPATGFTTPLLDEEKVARARMEAFSQVARSMAHDVMIPIGDEKPAFQKSSDQYSIRATRRFGAITLECSVQHHEAVCEKEVVRKRKVSKRDPKLVQAALDAIPLIEVEEDDIRWKCPDSLLAPAAT